MTQPSPSGPRPFRFGVQLAVLRPGDWVQRLRLLEELGFSTVFWPDHFGTQWEPVAALAAAAAVTERLHVGSLVYDVDYRHPVVLAKSAATIQLLSGGRHEFGIGAGWMRSDYDEAGIAYDRPGVRIERLEEALEIIRSMWTQQRTSFEGRHYHVKGVAQAAELPAGQAPKILIGGGGRRLLGVAGRHADIVGINPSIPEGQVMPHTPHDLLPERVREKIGWVKEAAVAAGRDPEALELNSLVFVTAVTDDPKPLREGLARSTGMSVDDVAECAGFLVGPGTELRERLLRRREETGISYVVIQGGKREMLERFAAEVVEPLTRT
jgi:probable F420-dependent oxidoreductase